MDPLHEPALPGPTPGAVAQVLEFVVDHKALCLVPTLVVWAVVAWGIAVLTTPEPVGFIYAL